MGKSEGAEDSVSHISMCPSGSTGLWWDDQPEQMSLNYTRAASEHLLHNHPLSCMELLLAKTQDWDRMVNWTKVNLIVLPLRQIP